MKVVVFGAGGQLASEIEKLKKTDLNWSFYSFKDIDITNYNSIQSKLVSSKIDLIINCAAYTNVEKSEIFRDSARNVNEKGVLNLVKFSKKKSAKMIHFSTDYVFDGKSSIPYSENYKTDPINYYGLSKRNGEKIICSSSVKSIIIRTSWVFSKYGNNFVNKILELSTSQKKLNIVSDQFGCPTYALDLAEATISIINSSKYKWSVGDIFHYSNSGTCSWYDFAVSICEISNVNVVISPIKSNELNLNAIRPRNSTLNCEKIIKTFDLEIRSWKNSLLEMLK